MARNNKFDNIDIIMDSATMTESNEFSHAKNEVGKVLEIDLKQIEDNPYQPRLEIRNDELIDLSNSILENGLLQPVLLNRISNDKYQVIAGHRRVAAHKLLHMDTVQSIIISSIDTTDKSYTKRMSVNALIENLQRENLDVIETSISLQNLLNEKIYKTKDALSKAIGKKNAYVSKILSILKLNEYIINDLRINKTIKDIEILYELQKITNSKLQIQLYKEIVKGKLTRSELREYNKKNILSSEKVKIVQRKEKYEIKQSNNKIMINFLDKSFPADKKKVIYDEIEQILAKIL